MVEPASDAYETLRAEAIGLVLADRTSMFDTPLVEALEDRHVDYRPGTFGIPTVRGTLAPMPVLTPDGYDPPVLAEVLDALVAAAWAEGEE
jgi:hypothetical protein